MHRFLDFLLSLVIFTMESNWRFYSFEVCYRQMTIQQSNVKYVIVVWPTLHMSWLNIKVNFSNIRAFIRIPIRVFVNRIDFWWNFVHHNGLVEMNLSIAKIQFVQSNILNFVSHKKPNHRTFNKQYRWWVLRNPMCTQYHTILNAISKMNFSFIFVLFEFPFKFFFCWN